MKNKKKLFVFFLFLIGCFGLQLNTLAANSFLAQIQLTNPFPSAALIGKEIVGDYTLHLDDYGINLRFVDQSNLPAGTAKTSGTGYCGESKTLHPNENCIARFIIPVQNSETTLTGKIYKYIDGTDFTLTYKPFSIRVVSTPQPGMPTLSVSPSSTMHIYPGQYETVNVTNDSPTITANCVNFITTDAHIDTTNSTSCAIIAPSATSSMKIYAKEYATATTEDVSVQLQGSNTYTANTSVAIDEAVSAPNITIATPGTTNLTLANHASLTAYVDSITIDNTLHSITSDITGCTAGFGGTCNIGLTATQSSYSDFGSPNAITIKYHLGSEAAESRTIISHATVSYTTLQLQDSGGTSITEMSVPLTGTSTFRFSNAGNFNWQDPHFELTAGANFIISNNTCTSAPPTPGNYCTFEVKATGSAGDTAQLITWGKNVDFIYSNITAQGAAITITADIDPVDAHLFYKAIKLSTGSNPVTFTTITPNTTDPKISGKVSYCSPSDSSCDYKTENVSGSSCVSGGTLNANSSCRIWFKANDSTSLATVNDGTVSVSATVGSTTYSKNFTTEYSYDVYVGGSFTNAGSTAASKIASWGVDGWYRLGSGLNGNCLGLATYKGDLYAGGYHTTAGGITARLVARWNGSNWSALPNGFTDGDQVWELYNYGGSLYIGGNFHNTSLISNTHHVVAWDGSSFSKLGDGPYTGNSGACVTSLVSVGSNLYAGGWFYYLDKWDGSSWSIFLNNTNGYIFSVDSMNDGNLYAFGGFYIGGTRYCAAKYDGSSWTNLKLGSGSVGVRKSLYKNNKIYVVGNFLSGTNGVSPITLRKIAAWNGSVWEAFGDGFTTSSCDIIGVESLAANDVYAVGCARLYDNTLINYIARWNGVSWSKVGIGADNGLNSEAYELKTAPYLYFTAQ